MFWSKNPCGYCGGTGYLYGGISCPMCKGSNN